MLRSPACALAAVLFAFSTSPAAPVNDQCANAVAISAIPQTQTVTLDGATAQASDPPPSCYPISRYDTVWFKYTSPTDRQVSFDTSGSSSNSTIAVFTGSCAALTQVDCDWTYGTNDSATHGRVDFLAKAGVTYTVMVASPFDLGLGHHVSVLGTAGQSAPVTVTVREEGSELPLSGAHVWIRDLTGGNYTLRDGFTGADGKVILYPPMKDTFDAQAIRTGHQNDAAPVSNNTPGQVTLRLPRMGAPLPVPSRLDPPRLAGSIGGCIVTLLPDGTDLRAICPGGQVRDPVWSPDGNRLAFFGREYHGQGFNIFLVDADGSDLTLLDMTGYASAENLTWSPDGQWLAYDRFDPWNGFSSIYRVNVATGAESHVLDFGTAPSYSPDGSMLAYDGSSGVRIARADGRDPVMVSDLFGNPAWSPDGTRIAVNYGLGAGANEGITVMNADGTNRQTVHGVAWQGAIHPTWSPDGRKIAFMDEELGDYYLTLVDVADHSIQRIFETDLVLESRIDWASHGTYDAPEDRGPNVDVIFPDGGEWFRPGEEVTITWHASDDQSIAAQDVWLDANGLRTLLAGGLPGDARSLTWQVPNDLWSYCEAWIDIEVTDTGGQKARDFSRYAFSVSRSDQGHVRVAIKTPVPGQSLEPGQPVSVTWDVDSYFSIGGFDLFVSHDGGFTWNYAVSGIPYTARSTTWVVTGNAGTRTYLRLLPISANGTTFDEVGPLSIAVDEVRGVSVGKGVSGTVTWSPLAGAGSYDVVRGSLADLRERRGGLGLVDLSAAAGPSCLADNASLLSVSDPAQPPPGTAWYYDVRPNGSGARRGVLGRSSAGFEHEAEVGGCP